MITNAHISAYALPFLLGAGFGAYAAYYFVYSPKAQVERLWRTVFKLSKFRLESDADSVKDFLMNGGLDEEINLLKNKINFLLDNYFEPDNDSDFIERNRP